MFAQTQMPGMELGFPDVCITPSPAGPIPVPYPNTAQACLALPPTTALNILIEAMPVHNMGTSVPISMGDNAGVGLGVVSAMVMGPCHMLTGSFTCLFGGEPTWRLTSITAHNGLSMNCAGAALVPSQVKVLILAP